MIKNLFVFILSLLFIVISGCNNENSIKIEPDKVVSPLADKVNFDLMKIKKIEVLFGDGRKLLIDGKEDIDKISKQLILINVEKQQSEIGPGYLYNLEIYEDKNTISVSNNTISIEGENYKPVGDEMNKLNKIIIELGRKQLSGIEI
ncbi:hypothetical protein [Paenibacillus algicola]|uniref:hypothetical protein n=1 Tax=Paenibacillus algicola TaxID=2565926 RepID=UPI0010FE7361|nr:hypothetical protein [Paenibacillus algicola]